jgi:hypothetical protein
LRRDREFRVKRRKMMKKVKRIMKEKEEGLD